MLTLVPAQQLEGVHGFMWRGMCHVYFMSTAMDSWSGFRDHAVIFHHVSVPLNSQCLCPEAMRPLVHRSPWSVCVFFCVAVRGREKKTLRQNQKAESNTERGKTRRRGGKEREKRKGEWRESLLPENRWPPNSQWPHGDLEGQLFAPPGYQRCGEGWGT